jgi:hypothetical protein
MSGDVEEVAKVQDLYEHFEAEFPDLNEEFEGKRYGVYSIFKSMTEIPSDLVGFVKKKYYVGRTHYGRIVGRARKIVFDPARFFDHNRAKEEVSLSNSIYQLHQLF